MRYDDCATTATVTPAPTRPPAAKQTRTEHAGAASSQEECVTPPASTKKVAAKKKSQDLTPLMRSNRVLDQDKRSRSTKWKPQDLAASVPKINWFRVLGNFNRSCLVWTFPNTASFLHQTLINQVLDKTDVNLYTFFVALFSFDWF